MGVSGPKVMVQELDHETGVVEHSIEVGGRAVSGPSVRVEVRDND